jgi:ubiquitin-protein ligase
MYERLHRSAVISYEITETVSPLKIPVIYHINYRLRSIVGINDDQQPVYGDYHTMRLEIPPEFPVKPTIPYMITDAWHPNIKSEGLLKGRVCANSVGFGRNFTLAQMVLRVGEILQWKNYLAAFEYPFPEDPIVAEWVLNFAEPNDIVNLEKGIAVDNTPLLTPRPEPTAEGPAPDDSPIVNEQTGFSISKRPSTEGEKPNHPATSPLSAPGPPKDHPDTASGGGISITPRD